MIDDTKISFASHVEPDLYDSAYDRRYARRHSLASGVRAFLVWTLVLSPFAAAVGAFAAGAFTPFAPGGSSSMASVPDPGLFEPQTPVTSSPVPTQRARESATPRRQNGSSIRTTPVAPRVAAPPTATPSPSALSTIDGTMSNLPTGPLDTNFDPPPGVSESPTPIFDELVREMRRNSAKRND